jgi:hypothetical protein
MMEALSSSETSVLTKGTPRNMTEDGILHGHRRENLKSSDIKHQFVPHRKHYFFATESSWLILCKSLGFHGC